MTSRFLITFAFLLLCAGAAGAQSGEDAALIAVGNQWVAALGKGNAAALDALLWEGYVDTDETGHRSDKHALIAALKSKALKFTAIKLSNMKVHRYGAFAVVTGDAEQAGTYQGNPLPKRIVFTDSFIMRDGDWRPVASHRTATQ